MSSNTETQTHEPQAPASPQTSAYRPVVLTQAANPKVKAVAEEHEQAAGKNLRLFVQGGGCSGFEYGFTFDEKKDTDNLIAQQAGDLQIEVLVDSFSLPYLEGCVVDFVEDFSGSGFKVENPNATGTCGCGHSFAT
jgi:iron-sulfur cluster insertion protein